MRHRLLALHHTRRCFTATASSRMKVVPVPVREDNYAYLLVDEPSNKAAAVDPYDMPRIQATADELGVSIVAAITTHHHFDHSGGNEVSLKRLFKRGPVLTSTHRCS